MTQTYDYNLKRAVEIMQSVLYATVATVSGDGKPWNSPVAKFYDNQMHIYWFSDKNSQHSINIRTTKRVFICIYDSTMAEGTGEGLYVEATAKEVNEVEDISRVCALQTGDWKVDAEAASGDAIHRFYEVLPEKVWMNDVEEDAQGNYIRDTRVEIKLENMMDLLT